MPFQATGDVRQAVWALSPTLRQLVETGDRELVEELLTDFEQDTAQRLGLMARALAAADCAAVCLEAHTIKGSALQVGANRLADLSSQLEQAARHGRLEDIPALFGAVRGGYEEVRAALARRSQQNPAGASSPYGE